MQLKQLFCALDAGQSSGSVPLSGVSAWHFTTQQTYDLGAVRLMFDQEISGKAYVLAIGVDGSDITDSENVSYAKPSFADFGVIVPADQVSIVAKATGLAAAGEFLQNLDWSPLWVSLRTTGIAIVFIVILGLVGGVLLPEPQLACEEHLRRHLHHPHGAAAYRVRLHPAVHRAARTRRSAGSG